MNIRLSHAVIRTFTFIALSFLITSCTNSKSPEPLPPTTIKEVKKQRPKPVVKPHYEMYDYVKELALAKYDQDVKSLKVRLAVIQGFAEEKRDKAISQPVIIITYNIKGQKETKQLIAPFKMSKYDEYSFPDLLEILTTINGTEYTIDDIHPLIVTNLPEKNLQFPEQNIAMIRKIVDNELQSLLVNSAALPDIDEANVQLHLMQLFMAHHIRDAAYLAAENAKQSLANAEQAKSKSNMIKLLSIRLDTLENQLHKEMPFTINSL